MIKTLTFDTDTNTDADTDTDSSESEFRVRVNKKNCGEIHSFFIIFAHRKITN